MAERVCSRALGKTISKTVAKPREYTRANRSSSFRAERERSVRQRDKHARGGDGSRDLCARPVKSVRAPAPGIFPDFQFICRHKARMPAAVADNGKRGTIARCKRCRSLSTLYPAAQVTRAAEHGFYRILSIHEIPIKNGRIVASLVESGRKREIIISRFLYFMMFDGDEIKCKLNGIENVLS